MGIDEVFARLANDPVFAVEVARDPRRALAGYDLSSTDLQRLDDELAARDGSTPQRGQSSLRALLTRDDDVEPDSS